MVAGTDGTRKKRPYEAVHREHLVIGVGGHQRSLRRQQLQADEARERTADKEEKRDRNQVQRAIRL